MGGGNGGGVLVRLDPDVDAEAQAERANRALVDAIGSLEDGLLLYDADDRLVLVNRRVLELVPTFADLFAPGVSFESIVREAAARGFYHVDGRSVDEIVRSRLASPLPSDGRLELHVDGDRIVQVKESRTRDGGRLVVLTDVTALRRATAALEESERNYRLMVDGVDDIIYRTNPEGIFTYVNARVSETMGWTADELIGTFYLDLIRPDYRVSAARFYLSQFTRRVPSTYYEFPAVAKDGSEVWVGQQVRLVVRDGALVGALAVARDITARKRADEYERDRGQIVEGIAENAPLAETLEQLVCLFERRAPGWHGAVLLGDGRAPGMVVAPSWPPCAAQVLTAGADAGDGASWTADAAGPRQSDGAVDPASGVGGRGRAAIRPVHLDERTAWSAPIHGRDGAEIGRWVMLADGSDRPGHEIARLVLELAQLAAIAAEHARLTERLEARIAQARTLNDLMQSMTSSLDLETVLGQIARAASTLLDAPVARFWMIDEESRAIWLAADASEGPSIEHGASRLGISDLKGILGWVARERQAVRIADAAADGRVADAGWWAARGLTSFLGQPVMLDGRLLAVLVLWGREPFVFDADEEALLESFVSQAALSIRNAQLYRSTDQQRQRLQSLVEVSYRLSQGLDLSEVLDAITEAAATIFEGEAGLRLLVGDELVRASVSRGARQRPSMERVTTIGGMIGEVLGTGQPSATPDVSRDERVPGAFREILLNDELTALLVAPIRLDDRVLGTLHIYRERGYEWRDDALHLAAGLADQAAMAIENATRYAGLQDSLERAKIPARVNQMLSTALDLDVLLREIAAGVVKVTNAVLASVWVADEEARTLSQVAFSDPKFGAGKTFRRTPFGEGWVGWVARHRQPLDIPDVLEDERTVEHLWWRSHDLSSAYALPVLDGDRLVAVISIAGREPIQIGEDNRELLATLTAQVAAAIRNAALYREVSAANRRLEEEVHRNELLLNSVADGVFGTDASGRLTFVNPAALRMLGYSRDELLGQDAHRVLHHGPAERHTDVVEQCQVLRMYRTATTYYNSDDTLWRRDDQPIAVACIGAPIEHDGMQIGAVITFRDISREKEAERQRRALAQSEKLRALGQLAGGVAHDLNQSLGLVVGHSELALDAVKRVPDVAQELRESLETIMQGALDGAQTVKRLQTFVRGQPEGAAERVALGSLITDVVRLTAPRWRDAAQAAGTPVSVTVNMEMAGDDEILGWPASLREALTNLVFNALDAMPGGGDLQISLRPSDRYVVVDVTDTGVGMPPEVAARVFEPFFTTKGERGTGLGLAMVYGIVERHAGRVEIESAPGRGTTFRLLLPRATRSAATGGTATSATDGRARTILIVDDEDALRRMLTRILMQDGHTVVAAASADEALTQMEQQRFDVVLSDHGLGLGMNGLELATAIRDRWPGTRFILVTGWGGTIDPEEVRPMGVEAVIGKPYRAPELRERINAAP
ncbi:MAG: GAF domain-containing protein [Chloroflexota bacterium]